MTVLQGERGRVQQTENIVTDLSALINGLVVKNVNYVNANYLCHC